MVDYDIVPTDNLYELLLINEEYLVKLTHEYEICKKNTELLLSVAINRKNGKGQMGFEDWDKSKVKENWREIIG
jgi:hypothetical protein